MESGANSMSFGVMFSEEGMASLMEDAEATGFGNEEAKLLYMKRPH
jgi:hypothetical protein